MEVNYLPTLDRARFDGLMVCGSVWLCPVCAARITEERRRQLSDAVSFARDHALRVLMETHTVSHHASDRLGNTLPAFRASVRHLMTSRAASDDRVRFGLVGSVRSLEVTYGGNGWHVHTHRLVFLPQEQDTYAYSLRARVRWAAATAANGLHVNEHGYRCDDTNEAAAAYVAKYGHDRHWDEAWEVSKWHVKHGRSDSLTPFDLLRASLMGSGEMGAAFREYGTHFKGQRQLTWSAGLRELMGICELSDQEAAMADGDALRVWLGRISAQEWRVVLANDARAEILAAARASGWPGVVEVLSALGGEAGSVKSACR